MQRLRRWCLPIGGGCERGIAAGGHVAKAQACRVSVDETELNPEPDVGEVDGEGCRRRAAVVECKQDTAIAGAPPIAA